MAENPLSVYEQPVTFSFILPTMGRDTLPRVLQQLKDEMSPFDEALVAFDGPMQHRYSAWDDDRFYFFETPYTHNHGNTQRDHAIKLAKNEFIVYIDDDDLFIPGAIEKMRTAIQASNRDVPHIFNMRGKGGSVIGALHWYGLTENLCGAVFVPPNVKEKLHPWDTPETIEWTADVTHTHETLKNFGGWVKHPEMLTYLERGACL